MSLKLHTVLPGISNRHMSSAVQRQGIDLVRAEYIPDDISDIRQTVLRLKERVGSDGFIFSSGGIGPTHDDVTYEALASAFGAPCQDCSLTRLML